MYYILHTTMCPKTRLAKRSDGIIVNSLVFLNGVIYIICTKL